MKAIIELILSLFEKEGHLKSLSDGFPFFTWVAIHLVIGISKGIIDIVIILLQKPDMNIILSNLVLGLLIGWGQWAFLNKYKDKKIPSKAFWIGGSTLVWLLTGILLPDNVPLDPVAQNIRLALGGVLLGLVQFLLLRHIFKNSIRVLLFNCFAWLIAGLISYALGLMILAVNIPLLIAWVLEWGLILTIAGFILGFAFKKLIPKT